MDLFAKKLYRKKILCETNFNLYPRRRTSRLPIIYLGLNRSAQYAASTAIKLQALPIFLLSFVRYLKLVAVWLPWRQFAPLQLLMRQEGYCMGCFTIGMD